MFNDPRTMALMAMGSSMLQSGGWSPQRTTFSQALGRGIQDAMGGYQQGVMNQQMQNKAKMAQRELMQRQQAQDYMKSIHPDTVQSGDKTRQVATQMMMSGNPYLMQYGKQMLDTIPKVKGMNKVLNEEGRAVYQPYDEYGNAGEMGTAPAAEKLMQSNLGNRQAYIDPYTGEERASASISMSPGESARLSQADRHFGANYGMQQARLGMDARRLAMDEARTALDYDLGYQAEKQGGIAGARQRAKNEMEARDSLPSGLTLGRETLRSTQALLADEGTLKLMTGKTRGLGDIAAMVGGGDAARWKANYQQFSNQTFLDGIKYMRGFGQLTEMEGRRMQEAMNAATRAQNEEDFTAAVRRYEQALVDGLAKIVDRAGGSVAPGDLQLLQQMQDEVRNRAESSGFSFESNMQGILQQQPQQPNDGWGEMTIR